MNTNNNQNQNSINNINRPNYENAKGNRPKINLDNNIRYSESGQEDDENEKDSRDNQNKNNSMMMKVITIHKKNPKVLKNSKTAITIKISFK